MTRATGRRGITQIVKRQYIGNLGKIENGIVAVTAYGVIEHHIPLLFKIYKPKNDSRDTRSKSQKLQPR